MQNLVNSLHNLSHSAINDLQSAFQECKYSSAGGLILSAMVKIRDIHNLMPMGDTSCSDIDPEEYCSAV